MHCPTESLTTLEEDAEAMMGRAHTSAQVGQSTLGSGLETMSLGCKADDLSTVSPASTPQ